MRYKPVPRGVIDFVQAISISERILLCALVGGFVLPSSMAQVPPSRVGMITEGQNELSFQRSTENDKLTPRNLTAELLREPTYRDVPQKIEELRRATRRKQGDPPKMGDLKSFFVRDVLNFSEWTEIEAELVVRAARVQFWMEREEVKALRDRGLLRRTLDSLKKRTLHRTLPGSVARSRGILPIAHDNLGHPPNVDGDGRLDVLLLDIHDRFEHTGSYVAGFFDPNDLTTNVHSNRRDLLYIDTRPTILRGEGDPDLHLQQAAATLAHEYQHLIHANYEGETRERTFVNEGLSEYAEILCGFPPRSPKAHFAEPGRPLMSWNYGAPLADYARASLFTHYLFEQIGVQWADDLLQNSAVGIDGVRMVLQQADGPSFSTLFRNWGRALLLNDPARHSAYGYRHPERRDIRFEAGATMDTVPGTLDRRMGALSHLPIDIPLVDRVSVNGAGRADLVYDARVRYPGAPDQLEAYLGEGEVLSTERGRHGSVQLLATNLSTTPDSQRVDAKVLVTGRRSARHHTMQYGDGVPDAYSGNASYLLLEKEGESVGLTFGTDDPAWLYGIAVDVVFRSELQGSEVSTDVPRRVNVQVHKLEDGMPGVALTPPLTRSVDRPVGNLKMEPFFLIGQYDPLSALRDSVVVVLQSGDRDNPLAVGMDRVASNGLSASAFHRDASTTSWNRLRTVRAEGTSLQGYRPMIAARVTLPERRVSSSTLQIEASHAAETAYVRIHAPFPVDSSRAQLVARLSSGRIVEGNWVDTPPSEAPIQAPASNDVLFTLPADAGATYDLFARAESQNHTVVRRTFRWKIGNDAAVRVGTPRPNPTHGDVKIPVTVLDPSWISVTLFDALGRRVRPARSRAVAAGTHSMSLDLGGLASGTYFARVVTHRRRDGYRDTHTRKIIRVR